MNENAPRPGRPPDRSIGLAGPVGLVVGMMGLAVVLQYSTAPELPEKDRRHLTPASGQPPMFIWKRAAPTSAPGQMLLLESQQELSRLLRRARQHLDEKQYTQAVDILQPLIATHRREFEPATIGASRYLSVWSVVRLMLSTMDEEGLATYRNLYDAKAKSLLDEARPAGDLPTLWRVVEEYGQTSWACPALDLIGAIQFDRGHFTEAAVAWDRLLARRPRAEGEDPSLLARLAVAHHLAGDSDKAGQLLQALKTRHPQAKGSIAGRSVDLAEFVERTLASPAPLSPADAPWPCLAGSPTGLPRRSPCPPVVALGWAHPADANEQLRMAGAFLESAPLPPDRPATTRPAGTTGREGQVLFKGIFPEPQTIVLPAAIHPIVTGGLAVYRADREVVACDLAGGRTVWQTQGLPVYRRGDPNTPRNDPPIYWAHLGDMGRYTLTAGEDKVFTVCKFTPGKVRGGDESHFRQFTSALAALSVPQKGKVLWEVGNGLGDTEVIRDGAFLTAPTYRDGRLYAVVRCWPGYFLVCLDAQTGAAIWESFVGQDLGGSAYLSNCGDLTKMDILPDRAAPPTLAGDKVFVSANSGLVVALSAATGRYVWAYQYNSILTQRDRFVASQSNARKILQPLYPPNPIIAVEDRIIYLPADDEKVLALEADTGKLLWQADRRKQHDLTGIDRDRLLLSGSGLIVLRTSDGTVLAEAKGSDDILGRPLVASDAVLACGRGRIVRMDLQKYGLSAFVIAEGRGLLGGLVRTGSGLLAANLGGICLYRTGG